MEGLVIKKSPHRNNKTESDIAKMFIERSLDENIKFLVTSMVYSMEDFPIEMLKMKVT